MKVNSRFNLVGRFSGTKLGSGKQTLRTTRTALVHSATEYCTPVWLNSVHVNKVDVQLNNAIRLNTGTVKSTPLQWLSVLSNIAPPRLRREESLFRDLKSCWSHSTSLLLNQLQVVPLQIRSVIWTIEPGPLDHW
jgi:hypothetical protein